MVEIFDQLSQQADELNDKVKASVDQASKESSELESAVADSNETNFNILASSIMALFMEDLNPLAFEIAYDLVYGDKKTYPRQRPKHLLSKAKQMEPIGQKLSRDFATTLETDFKDIEDYPYNKGKLCCTHFVSHMLGLKKKYKDQEIGRYGRVMDIIPLLIASNLEATQGTSTGIIMNREDFKIGSVIAFFGTDNAKTRFGHVAIKVDNVEIDGHNYSVVAHDEKHTELIILPDDPDATEATSKAQELISQIHTDPDRRAAILEENPTLAKWYQARGYMGPEYMYVGERGSFEGRAAGEIAFAIDTNLLA